MKSIGSILLACLTLALQTVAQAPEKAEPDDLVVTAEVVGHSHEPAESPESKSKLILYVRLNIRNQTNHPRDITTMSCGWDDSWINKGAFRFCGWGCDKNIDKPITIPAGQSVIFYGPVCRLREKAGETTSFALGFIDFMAVDFWSSAFRSSKAKRWSKLLNARAVYWSNELNGNIDLATTPEVTGSDQYPRYSLSESGK